MQQRINCSIVDVMLEERLFIVFALVYRIIKFFLNFQSPH